MTDQIVEWAKELQSLAQAGLFYGRDVYDRERYQRIREISAEMMASRTGIPAEKVAGLFCGTPIRIYTAPCGVALVILTRL